MKRLIALAGVCIGVAFAQVGPYVVTQSANLAGSAAVVTVQQPASKARTVRFDGAYIDTSVALTVTLERDGTAATTTEAAVASVNPDAPTAKATAFTDSNVGVGTVLATYQIPANSGISLDLSDKTLVGIGTGKNLTIRTSSATGTVNITIKWKEIQ